MVFPSLLACGSATTVNPLEFVRTQERREVRAKNPDVVVALVANEQDTP